MKRLTISLTIAAVAILAAVATVAAAGPTPTPAPASDPVRARDTITTILGLSQAEVMDLRQEGLTLATIAQRQGVDSQKLVDALVAQWSARIDVRVANGALTAAEAATLKVQLTARAETMVSQATPGGMRGAAVGAGRGAMGGAGNGRGAGMGASRGGFGSGMCDGNGPDAVQAP